jgi:hypothetical protein
MVIPSAVAFGVLASVSLLVLVAFVIVFMRLDRAPKRIEEDRPPMPLGWPTIPHQASAASAPPVVRPVGLRALWRRSDRS